MLESNISYDDFDDSPYYEYLKNHRKKKQIVKNQKYYDEILDDIDIKYIENYLRCKKIKNINK